VFILLIWPLLIIGDVMISSYSPVGFRNPVNSVAGAVKVLAVENAMPAPSESVILSAPPAAVALQTAAPAAKNSTAWHKEQIMYFPLTDRFADGDTTNNFAVDRSHPAGFWGGDLKGLTEKLDYIQSLGATSIWLSPLADNTEQMRIGDYHGYGHHGYWIRDHYAVEEHQGSMADAKNLVAEAHKRGLKVVLDVVLNHVGPDAKLLQDPTKKDWFHNKGGINDWNNPLEVEQGDLGGLPDLNQSNPEAYKYLVDNTLWWIKEVGVDGIRLDAVKHVSRDVWSKLVPEIKEKSGKDDLFVMGEAFHGDPNVVASYQKAGIDFLFDLPLYYTMRETFGQGQSMKKVAERLAQDSLYSDAGKLVTVLDNHDLPRFLSTANKNAAGEGDKRLQQALAFQMTVRGIPSVYYGTEAAFSGGEDPHNREMMDFKARPDMVAHMQKLTELRNSSEALQHGAQREMWVDDGVYAFSRATDSEEIISVFHNGTEAGQRSIPLRGESHFQDGTVLVDVLSGQEFTVKDRKLDLSLQALTPLVLKVKS
jgi:alpha-amylase